MVCPLQKETKFACCNMSFEIRAFNRTYQIRCPFLDTYHGLLTWVFLVNLKLFGVTVAHRLVMNAVRIL